MKCNGWDVGVCSWSLRASVVEVAAAMERLGLEHVHLAVRVALEEGGERCLEEVHGQSWTISSTMIDFPQEDYSSLEAIKITGGIAPDECWERNRELFFGAVDVTAALGVEYISTHAGFIDHRQGEYAEKFYSRIKVLADAAAEKGVELLLETGQETAEDLRLFLEELDHPAVGVNFDPANMILYDKGDPLEAVGILAPWIRHVHIKDAIPTQAPGTWGTEVPWGRGQVRPGQFLKSLAKMGYGGVLAIELESGNDRFGDIAGAIEELRYREH